MKCERDNRGVRSEEDITLEVLGISGFWKIRGLDAALRNAVSQGQFEPTYAGISGVLMKIALSLILTIVMGLSHGLG